MKPSNIYNIEMKMKLIFEVHNWLLVERLLAGEMLGSQQLQNNKPRINLIMQSYANDKIWPINKRTIKRDRVVFIKLGWIDFANGWKNVE